MRVTQRTTIFLASLALLMALLAFALGTAPFTPALVLAALAIPLASLTIVLGARRLSIVALYWAIAAILSLPLSRLLSVRIDNVLVAMTVIGIGVSTALLVDYLRSRREA